jgi:hypothetical protein
MSWPYRVVAVIPLGLELLVVLTILCEYASVKKSYPPCCEPWHATIVYVTRSLVARNQKMNNCAFCTFLVFLYSGNIRATARVG